MIKSFKGIRNYNLRTLKTVEDFNWNGSEKPEEYLETKFKVLELKNKKIIFLVTDFVALLFFAICLVKTIPNIVQIPVLLIIRNGNNIEYQKTRLKAEYDRGQCYYGYR